VLGAHVGGAELARLLVRRQQRGLRVGCQRGGDVGALALLGLLLELGRDRVGIRADLFEDVADDVVLKRAEEQVVALWSSSLVASLKNWVTSTLSARRAGA
jgi:hypothetical protein